MYLNEVWLLWIDQKHLNYWSEVLWLHSSVLALEKIPQKTIFQLIFFSYVYLVLLHINRKYVYVFLYDSNQIFFGGKEIRKISISDAKILKKKRKNATTVMHKVLIFFFFFLLLLVSSATYLLEVSARVSLRVVTDSVYRGKKSSKICIFDVIM